ncbi:SGNH/GDSL hydrolase family protein [Synechocystis sp. LKSZ1]|uniref:SGNH/GDSL hydrolase family protein n=1 Tax=Synechocystis sp. LKSZ1 TaxID=3144951 RepID=UPI00336BC260
MAWPAKLKQLGLNLLLGLGGVGFAFGVAEIGLRLAGISYPSFYQVDPNRGHALIPNFSGQWTHEGNGFVQINRDGLRDKDHAIPKPEQTYRIAVLGDSFTEAIQINADQTFWAKLERGLASCPALGEKKPEVINFGVGDYGTAQALMTLRHQVGKYQPNLVLLAIFTGNDLVNNSRVLSPPDRLSPYLVQHQGQWVMDTSFNQTQTYQRRDSWPRRVVFSMINHSRVLQVLHEARRVWGTGQGLAGQVKNDDIIPSLDFDANLYHPPTSPAWQEAWASTEALLTQFNQESQALGANFVAVTLSNPPQVYPDLKVRQRLRELGAQNLFYPEQRLAQWGQQQHVPVLNLAPELQAYSDRQRAFLHGFENTAPGIGHWNALGHQVAGQLLTTKLCPLLAEEGKHSPN